MSARRSWAGTQCNQFKERAIKSSVQCEAVRGAGRCACGRSLGDTGSISSLTCLVRGVRGMCGGVFPWGATWVQADAGWLVR
eukprot:scaffold50073_cov80-Phaeocystis_antarctica.AAC.1